MAAAAPVTATAPDTPGFIAHPLCPPHLRREVEDLAESFDPGWLLPPEAGELFNTPDAAFRRLQGFAFSQGFAVVTRSTEATRCRFVCIHHSKKTKNIRNLKERVKKDSDNIIITERKRNTTQVAQKNCY
jgi:hypothetical protein